MVVAAASSESRTVEPRFRTLWIDGLVPGKRVTTIGSELSGTKSALAVPMSGLPPSVATGAASRRRSPPGATSNSQPIAATVKPRLSRNPSPIGSSVGTGSLNRPYVNRPRLTISTSTAPFPPDIGLQQMEVRGKLDPPVGTGRRPVQVHDHTVTGVLGIDREVQATDHLLVLETRHPGAAHDFKPDDFSPCRRRHQARKGHQEPTGAYPSHEVHLKPPCQWTRILHVQSRSRKKARTFRGPRATSTGVPTWHDHNGEDSGSRAGRLV